MLPIGAASWPWWATGLGDSATTRTQTGSARFRAGADYPACSGPGTGQTTCALGAPPMSRPHVIPQLGCENVGGRFTAEPGRDSRGNASVSDCAEVSRALAAGPVVAGRGAWPGKGGSIHVRRMPFFLAEICLVASLTTARLRCPLLIRERSPRGRAWGRWGWCTLSADAPSRCGPAGRACWRGRGASASRPSEQPSAASPWRRAPRTSA